MTTHVSGFEDAVLFDAAVLDTVADDPERLWLLHVVPVNVDMAADPGSCPVHAHIHQTCVLRGKDVNATVAVAFTHAGWLYSATPSDRAIHFIADTALVEVRRRLARTKTPRRLASLKPPPVASAVKRGAGPEARC